MMRVVSFREMGVAGCWLMMFRRLYQVYIPYGEFEYACSQRTTSLRNPIVLLGHVHLLGCVGLRERYVGV